MERSEGPPAACFHGGASFEAIGDTFDALDRRAEIINADVLDAWFPPAPGVIGALREALEWLAQTSPPTHAEGLVRVISQVRDVPEPCLLTGGGSSSLLYLALREWLTPDSRTLVMDPSYGEYPHLFENVIGCRVDRLPLRAADRFDPDIAEMERRIAAGVDLVVIVNPNSPTGRLVPRETLEAVIANAPPATRFWMDETYIEYAGSAHSLEGFASRSRNTIVCKSMSKVYALSGLRAAYLCGPPELISPLRLLSAPWSIGLPAQVAAVRALQDSGYYEERYEQTRALREALMEGLVQIGVAEVVPSAANFLLFRLRADGPDSDTVIERCRIRGLFLRNPAENSRAVDDRTLRVAVKDGETNARMLAILKEAISGTAAPPTADRAAGRAT